MFNSTRDFMLAMYGLHSVKTAQEWSSKVGLEYWAHFGPEAIGVSGDAHELGDYGWAITGTLADVTGSGADLLDPDDKGTPGGINIDTAGDALDSPSVFGDWQHGALVAELVGMRDLPTLLVCDWWGRFAANADEDASGVGFVEDGGTGAVANDHLAAISIDGTNFQLRSDTAAVALAAMDTSQHHFRIKLDQATGLAYGYIDDMDESLGSIALKTDEFPAKFGAGVLATTGTNFPVISAVRVRYGWNHLGI